MKLLQEVNTLTSIRLSETQKTVMCRIIAAPTEELAYEQVSDGTNIVAARDQLTDLGLITWSEGTAANTESGMQVLKDEALVDETGELTETGNGYAYGDGTENSNPQPTPDTEPAGPEAGGDVQRDGMPQDNSGGGEQDPMADLGMDLAGFDLLKTINADILKD